VSTFRTETESGLCSAFTATAVWLKATALSAVPLATICFYEDLSESKYDTGTTPALDSQHIFSRHIIVQRKL
jgi:hypothetical protein